MISTKKAAIAAFVAGLLAASVAVADTIEVKIIGVKFVPDVIHARVGDVISFRNMATHFVESVEGMWPEGAPKMLSPMGADYVYPLVKDGVYVFKCPPHWGARMGGIMVVGEPADLNATLDAYYRVAEMVREAKPAKSLLHKIRDQAGQMP